MNKEQLDMWREKVKYKFTKIVLDHQQTIQICLGIARSIHNFALSKSPLSFIEGGINAIVTLSSSLNGYSHQFFNSTNGWSRIVGSYDQRALYDIFSPVVRRYKFKYMPFKHNTETYIGIYDTPCGRVGLDPFAIWFQNNDKVKTNDVLSFLVAEKMKDLKTNFFSIQTTKDSKTKAVKFDLVDETLINIASATSTRYVNYIKNFIDKNIKRSILFNGPPGTGKTTLSQTIISSFGFKALKFKYDPINTNLDVIKFIIEGMKIDAVLIDDFDQFTSTNTLLEFLAWIHDNTKLVILLSNTTKNFHPAVKRPGRIDEIIHVKCLDEAVVVGIFGQSHPEIINKVKEWPIAFINELANRIKADPTIDIDSNIEELGQRVSSQAHQ